MLRRRYGKDRLEGFPDEIDTIYCHIAGNTDFGSSNGKLDKAITFLELFLGKIFERFEVFYFGGNMRRKMLGINLGDAAGATFPLNDSIP